MAKKTKVELFEQYRRRIGVSRRWRQQEGFDDVWRRLIDLYRGKHWEGIDTDEDLVAVNLAFSTVNVIAPSVSVNHPKIVVSANRPEDEDRAAFVEAVINHLWRHYDFRTPFKRAVKDFLIMGHGWLKVGWRFTEQEQSLSENEREAMMQEQMLQADSFAERNPELAGDLPTDEDIIANVPSTEMRIVADQPFVERISPFDVFVDPEATCPEDMTWIAQRVVRPLESAQKDKRYKPSVRKRLTSDAGVNPLYTDRLNPDEYVNDVERVTLWEFYDIKENTMCIFAESSNDEFLVDPVAMPYPFGQPFVQLRNYDIPDHFYPMGDLEALESLQEELDKTRSQLVNARKRFSRKYLYHERSFGPEGRAALESDEDNRLVPVVDENRPLSEVVVPLPQVPMSGDVYNTSQIIENDINVVSGVSEYARGAMPEIRRTATEAAIVADAGNARASDKLAIVELVIGKVARHVLQLMQAYMTGEQMARVAGRNNKDLYVKYERDDIIGEYDFVVEAGSTQPMNETMRRQSAVSLLNAMGPLVGQVIDPAALARHVLQQGFGITNPEKFLIQQQPAPEGPPVEGGPPPEGPPMGGPPMGGPPMGGMPMAPSPEGAFGATGGIPPELLAQLQGQMGTELPAF